MTLRASFSSGTVPSDPAVETREFYNRSNLPPYLQASTVEQNPTSDVAVLDRSTRTEGLLNEGTFAGEADAAAGSVMTRVRSLGRLRTAAQQSSSSSSIPIPREPRVRPTPPPKIKPTWPLKDKMRTAGVGLIMALNVGTDPPDIIKPNPCAMLQCWMDPSSVSRAKAKEQIGERLEAQYAQWQQQRTAIPLKYRRALDPTRDDVRALCMWLRRQARSDRILLHYNGHGVPRPTENGEIWVFDKNHTQYIPLSVTEMRQWMGKPNIVILDCSSAGVLMPFLTAPLEANDEADGARPSTPTPPEIPFPPDYTSSMEDAASQWISDTIVLCPTADKEWLPMHPEYPADIFTSCLTTPIQMALRWFVRCNPQSMGGLSPDAMDDIPGKANDRKTPLGELTWIFAAVTDSIAWNVLPRSLFQHLFRQDLLVAGMFRNFLLADRILRSMNCSPQSYPPLPPGVCEHPLWEAWDLACETCLYGLMRDGILGNPVEKVPTGDSASVDQEAPSQEPRPAPTASAPASMGPAQASSVSSPFFSEQLSAFEIWLEFASIQKASPGRMDRTEPFESPEQLPIVLQVLLTPAYRVRALTLLRRFLDLGPWAVNLALSVGILPYLTKLLQSPEYKQSLMGIWAKILAFDSSCQEVVLKDGGLPHFVGHLTWGMNAAAIISTPVDPKEAALQRTMAAFIVAVTCLDFPQAQTECMRQNLQGSCCALLSSLEFGSGAETSPDIQTKILIAEARVPAPFRMWLCICLGHLVKDNNLAQDQAFASGAHRRLLARLSDDSPDVSAAACYGLGCMLSTNRQGSRNTSNQDLTSVTAAASVQQPPATYAGSGGPVQPGLIPNRLMTPVKQAVGTGMSGRLQPTFASGQPGAQNIQWHPQTPVGLIPPHGTQLQQPTGYNTLTAGGMGMVPTTFGGRQMEDSLNRSQATFMSPQFIRSPPETQRQAPSVFEDESRLTYDVSVTDGLLEATEDASAMVRYEAVVSLGRAVEKYLPAFMALAHNLAMNVDTRQHKQLSSLDSQVVSANRDVVDSKISEREKGPATGDALPLPSGLDNKSLARFTQVWRTLRYLQRHDTYPGVASAANLVVSFVNEHILMKKMDQASTEEDDSSAVATLPSTKSEMFNTTGAEEHSAGSLHGQDSLGLRSLLSSPSISDHVQQEIGQISLGKSAAFQSSSGATDGGTLRRISSEHSGPLSWQEDARNVGGSKSDEKVASQDMHFATDYDLPKSDFYEWKMELFGEQKTDYPDADYQVLDPLSFEGAVRSYRKRRNEKVEKASKKEADHFASLAPKPPEEKKKQRFNLDIFDEEEEAARSIANMELAKKKKELEMKQTTCLRNDGADKSCLLRFHSYEDTLLVGDGQDGISIWDSRTNSWASKFRNGNPKGSLMTSGTWINETSNSLFLVGCDDGSVRVWDGLLEANGEVSLRYPTLAAAFFAAPDMVAGGQSGLILEWQQYTGRLLAGGNSNSIRCWDLGTEKCASVLATKSDACVTTICTAWDYESTGSRGLGPEIIVVGHGDGCMKLFDIRANSSAVATSRPSASGRAGARRPRLMTYEEHRYWIVSARFTAYGGRPEVVSGSIDGEIKMWDLRLSSSLRTITAQRRRMTALSVHPRIPVVATGSEEQFIKIMTLDGDTLQVIKYHEALAKQPIGPVSCLEYHPRKRLLAAGGTDSIVSIYSPKNT